MKSYILLYWDNYGPMFLGVFTSFAKGKTAYHEAVKKYKQAPKEMRQGFLPFRLLQVNQNEWYHNLGDVVTANIAKDTTSKILLRKAS